jgi:hypothetical protein
MTAVRPLAELLSRPFQVDPFLPIQLLERWQRIFYKTVTRPIVSWDWRQSSSWEKRYLVTLFRGLRTDKVRKL